jgi:hypothetical protein
MIDLFVILTPILVLGIIALLGFVGCDQVFGLKPVDPRISVDAVFPDSGTPAGGTNVVIAGSEFQAGCTVTFGGNPASNIVVLNDKKITAVTPQHSAGLVDVTVAKTGEFAGILEGAFTFAAVTHLQTVAIAGGGSSLSVPLPDFGSGTLIVAAVEWGGNATVTVSGAAFTQIEIDILNPQKVATFSATNVSGPITVTATLNAPTTTEANLLVSAYDFAGAAPDGPGSAHGTGTSAILPLQTSALSPGDLLYSVAIARTGGAVLSGALIPGAAPAFTAEAGAGSYRLVQDYVLQSTDVAAGQVNVGATNTSGTTTSVWYIFAMRIPHA